ncbi:hypothetical protein V5O48_019304, partial [Marasmius crinis-equi]
TFRETPDGPVRTINLPDNTSIARVPSLVRLLINWQRLEAIELPPDVEALLVATIDTSTERGRLLAEAVSRLQNLLIQRRRLREVLVGMLTPYMSGGTRGRLGISPLAESSGSL